jgi:hypothetical protein
MHPIGTRCFCHRLCIEFVQDSSNNLIGGWTLTRTTPENPQETASAGSSETIRQPSLIPEDEEMVRSLWRRREVDRNDRPATRYFVQSMWSTSNRISEIPCRVRHHLPLERVISRVNPANNGESLS